MVLLGFRYLASSIPLICLAGVAIGVGVIFAFLVLSICRNPSLTAYILSLLINSFPLCLLLGILFIDLLLVNAILT